MGPGKFVLTYVTQKQDIANVISYKKYDVDLTRVYCLHSAQGINEILGCRNDGMNTTKNNPSVLCIT